MVTKTIVIGAQESAKEAKKIDFKLNITEDGRIERAQNFPNSYKFIELICLNFGEGEIADLMFAYNHVDERYDGCLYLGKWNDGIV